jgi:SpoVK/Ycf46/Vps4 family AAA+-type ATPase
VSAEPEAKFGVLSYVDEKIVKTILQSPTRLPEVGKKNVSALLFGPPGTAKTTVVKAIAEALKWPVLSLNPGSFIEKGLEYIEAESKVVFDRLQKLSRVVVLFDECDELFRERNPTSATEQVRSITAFVTASMLPKLQDLHDRGRIVFFICTNHIETMDSAIRRGGRIDHLIGIGPPDYDARKRIIRDRLGDSVSRPFAKEAAEQLAKGTERFIRGELERAADLLGSDFPSTAAAADRVTKIVGSMVMGLTVSKEDFSNFEKLKLEFSYPHMGGGLK